MKLKLGQAVAFLVALGFAKAASWDKDKITQRLSQVPDKVGKDDVPEGHEELYQNLVAAKGKVELEGEAADGKPAKETPPADDKPAKGKPAKGKGAKETPPAAEPAKGKPAKKPAAAPAAKTAPRDSFGCLEGTISSKVNGVMTKEWMDEQEIVDAAGVTLDQARGRLYYAAEEGIFEHRRLVQYRVAPKAK